MTVRGKKLYVLRRAPEGEVRLGEDRFALVKEVEDPAEWIRRDPLGALARLAGLEECPYHPGYFLPPDKPCPVCLAEAEEAALETLREEGGRA